MQRVFRGIAGSGVRLGPVSGRLGSVTRRGVLKHTNGPHQGKTSQTGKTLQRGNPPANSFARPNRFNARHAAAFAVFGAIGLFGINEYKRSKNVLTKQDIDSLMEKGRVIISVDGHIYDITDFVENHPGGSEHLRKANGHDISAIWAMQEYRFHSKDENVQDLLKSFYIGSGELPAMPSDQSHYITSDDLSYLESYDKNNHEAKVRQMDMVTGVIEQFFVRNHGKYAEHVDLSIVVEGKHVTWTNNDLSKMDTEKILQAIICGGAGRAHFKSPVNGTLWGSKGADAIGTMLVDGVNLKTVLERSGVNLDKPCMFVVEGSDGYKTVIHSTELHRCYIATDLHPLHGKERRLVIKGGTGFRNIKRVRSIQYRSEPSDEDIDTILQKRWGSTMPFLPRTRRMILASCPECDAYVEHKNGVPFDFKLYLPLLCKITRATQSRERIHVEGLAFSGNEALDRATVCNGNGFCSTVPITLFDHSKGRCGFFKADVPISGNQEVTDEAKASRSGDQKETAEDDVPISGNQEVTASVTDKCGNQQPDEEIENDRGLYYYKKKQRAPVNSRRLGA